VRLASFFFSLTSLSVPSFLTSLINVQLPFLIDELDPEEYYPAFLDMVKSVLDGNMESVAYEDTLREMFGIHAYVAFTLDKVVSYAVRQLQHLVADPAASECHSLFSRESASLATGGECSTAHERILAELIYQKKAERLLADENCMKVFIVRDRDTMGHC